MGSIASFIEKKLLKKYVGSAVRHGMTLLGGVLVAKGIGTPEILDQLMGPATELTAGVVIAVVGWLLSLAEKRDKK